MFPSLKRAIAKTPFIGKYIYPFKSPQTFFGEQGTFFAGSMGYRDIHEVSNAKMAVIGLPKSGNVWLASLISDCLNLPLAAPWGERSKKGVCLFHDPLNYRVAVRSDIVRAVYLMRDLRDVVVSFYHFTQTEYFQNNIDARAFDSDIKSFYYNYFLTKAIPRYKWFDHAEKYVSAGLPVVRYEDLWDATGKELGKIFSAWQIEVSEEKIVETVEKNHISNLKEKGKDIWENKQLPQTHFRKGGYGKYKKALPDQVLDDINQRFGNIMVRWGYTTN